MANISAADVKRLRDLTSAGMMDSKKALEEADGDFDKAVEILRVKGAAKAQKRGAERTASAGLVATAGTAQVVTPFAVDKEVESYNLTADVINRAGQPAEVAPAFVFLASPADASYVSGTVLGVTGGKPVF